MRSGQIHPDLRSDASGNYSRVFETYSMLDASKGTRKAAVVRTALLCGRCYVPRNSSGELDVEPEVHDVAILHDVFFALGSHFAVLLYFNFAACCNVVLVGDYLCADVATLEI